MEGSDNWVSVLKEGQLSVGRGTEIAVADRMLGLFHLEAGWFAIEGTCPHHGGPLGQGELNGTCVVCPWHGLEVDVVNGAYHLGEAAQLRTYPVRSMNGEIQVLVD